MQTPSTYVAGKAAYTHLVETVALFERVAIAEQEQLRYLTEVRIEDGVTQLAIDTAREKATLRLAFAGVALENLKPLAQMMEVEFGN